MSNQNLQKHYKYMVNKQCEYYPCHKEIPEEQYNCLFCYCPFYFRDKLCPQDKEGGQARVFRTKSGKEMRDCSKCLWIHQRENYDEIISILSKDFN